MSKWRKQHLLLQILPGTPRLSAQRPGTFLWEPSPTPLQLSRAVCLPTSCPWRTTIPFFFSCTAPPSPQPLVLSGQDSAEQRRLSRDIDPTLSCSLCEQTGPEKLGSLLRVTSKLMELERDEAAPGTLPTEPPVRVFCQPSLSRAPNSFPRHVSLRGSHAAQLSPLLPLALPEESTSVSQKPLWPYHAAHPGWFFLPSACLAPSAHA